MESTNTMDQSATVGQHKESSYTANPLLFHRLKLVELAENQRAASLDRMESYYQCTQYNNLRYDWNGNVDGYAGQSDIGPGFMVPMTRRRPSARYDLPKVIVNKFTSFVFGKSRWPEISFEGDPNAESFAKVIVDESNLHTKMIEARNLGGCTGTACLSFAYVKGKPRVQVHNSKQCTVLSWDDPDDMRPEAVIEAYGFTRRVVEDGKLRSRQFYCARYWDKDVEIVWDPIPKELADTYRWTDAPNKVIRHNYGFCPFYWIQNIPDSYNVDGKSDYDGLLDNFDEINRLMSSLSRGAIANLDPTLVVKADPSMNKGILRKGGNNTIFSPGGAEYLELSGQSTQTGLELLRAEIKVVQETSQTVIVDNEKIASKAMSGEAMKVVYAPMLSKCDLLREQYGRFGIKPIVRDMLVAARSILDAEPKVTQDEEGNEVVTVASLALPPLVETVTRDVPTGEVDQDGIPITRKEHSPRFIDRDPGQSSYLQVSWGPYFPTTWKDISSGIVAAKEASGGKPVASQKTAVRMAAPLTGVEDIESEIDSIEEDAEVTADRAMRSFGTGDLLTDLANSDDSTEPADQLEEQLEDEPENSAQ